MKVRVTKQDIETGEAGNCFRCAVARALQRRTKDMEAHVFESDWLMRLQVHGRSIIVPSEVREFVWDFDAGNGFDAKPFTFEIPQLSDPEWDEQCYGCEDYFKPNELDDEGNCEECRDDERLTPANAAD